MVTELLEKKETNEETEQRKMPYFLLTSEVKGLLRFDSINAFNAFIANNEDFPKHINLGMRRKAYVRDEVIEWINNKLARRNS